MVLKKDSKTQKFMPPIQPEIIAPPREPSPEACYIKSKVNYAQTIYYEEQGITISPFQKIPIPDFSKVVNFQPKTMSKILKV